MNRSSFLFFIVLYSTVKGMKKKNQRNNVPKSIYEYTFNVFELIIELELLSTTQLTPCSLQMNECN